MKNNKIVHQVTKAYMQKNKKRTITTLLGIVFMVMLMTCVFVGKDTAVSYLEKLASMENGTWHLCVYDVTDDEYEQISKMEDMEQIGVSADFNYTMFAQSGKEERPYIHIKSYSEDAFDMYRIEAIEGRLPQAEDEIILNIEAVEDGADLRIGDTIDAEMFKRYIGKNADCKTTTMFQGGFTVAPGDYLEAPAGFPFFFENEDFYEKQEKTGENATYKIVGFMERPSFEKIGAGAYTAFTYNDGTKISGKERNLSLRFDLKNSGNYDTELQQIVGEDCEIEYNTILLVFTANSKDSTINFIVTFMSIFFVVLIVAASVVLIYNVFNMSFDERTKYLGMLSSVGATGKQKRSSVYYEAFSLLLIGLPIGFGMGLLVVKLGMMALKPYIDTLLGMYSGASIDKVSLVISVAGVIFTVVLSVLTVWISAYLPARKIGKTGPIECIRGNVGKSVKKRSTNKRAIRLWGAEGMLASNFVSREKKKTRGLIGAVAVFMSVLIVTSYFSKAVTTLVDYAMSDVGTVNVEMEKDFVATVGIGSQAEEEYAQLRERVMNDKSVASVLEYYNASFLARGEKRILSSEYLEAYAAVMDAYGVSQEHQELELENLQPQVSFIGFDDVTLAKIAKEAGADVSILQQKEKTPVILVQNGELSTRSMAFPGTQEPDYQFYEIQKMSDLAVGESFEVSILSGETNEYKQIPLTVAGYAANEQLKEYVTFHSHMVWVITDFETVENLVNIEKAGGMMELHEYSKEMYVKFVDKTSQLYSDLNAMHYDTLNSDDWEGLAVLSASLLDMTTIGSAINSVVEILLRCFVLLTSIICMMNLYNSTKGRITGRRKELAILRSMGMTEEQMRKMLLLEAGTVLRNSTVVAFLVTIPVIAVVAAVLEGMFGKVNLGMPVAEYLIAFSIAAVALGLITWVTHNREKSENILEDIRRECV